MKNKHSYAYIFIIIFLLTGCIPNNIQPDPLTGKLKSIKIYDTIPNSPVYHVRISYNEQVKIDSVLFYLQHFAPDSTIQFAYYSFLHNGNTILIESNGFNPFYPDKKYNAYLEMGKIKKIVELDYTTMAEFPFWGFVTKDNNSLDSIFEPNAYPLATDRKCYNFVFDGNNYSKFNLEYKYHTFFNEILVKDSISMTYSTLPNNKYVPGQNTLGSSLLSVNSKNGDIYFDISYYLGFDYDYVHKTNINLMSSINDIILNYNFNSSGQLVRTTLSNQNGISGNLTLDFVYY